MKGGHDMEFITAEQLADELHLDQTPTELNTLDLLIKDASALIRGSISTGLTEQDVLKVTPNTFNRLVSSVATSMYYDRALSEGLSHGQMIILQQIKGAMNGNV